MKLDRQEQWARATVDAATDAGVFACLSGNEHDPVALVAMAVKPLAQPVIQRLGYRRMLFSNTLLLDLLILAMSSLYHGSSYLW